MFDIRLCLNGTLLWFSEPTTKDNPDICRIDNRDFESVVCGLPQALLT